MQDKIRKPWEKAARHKGAKTYSLKTVVLMPKTPYGLVFNSATLPYELKLKPGVVARDFIPLLA